MRLLALRDHQVYIPHYLDLLCESIQIQNGASILDREKFNQSQYTAIQEKLYDSVHELFLLEKDEKLVGFSEVSLEQKCCPEEDLPELCLRIHSLFITTTNKETTYLPFFKLLKQWGRSKKASLIEVSIDKKELSLHSFFLSEGMELVGSGSQDFYRGFT